MSVRLVSYTPDAERQIELAYLACRNLDPWNPSHKRTTQQRIDAMWKSGHFSPFEFADATFYISGVSRSCSHQFVRHRIASYEQLSMRHVDASQLELIIPKGITDDTVGMYHNNIVYNYKQMIEQGVPKEDARFFLPIGIETRFMVKMNFRSWLHFLRLRTHPTAQWEIHGIAVSIYECLKDIAPNVFDEKYKPLWNNI